MTWHEATMWGSAAIVVVAATVRLYTAGWDIGTFTLGAVGAYGFILAAIVLGETE